MCGKSYFNRSHVPTPSAPTNQKKYRLFLFFTLCVLVTVVAGTQWYRIDWVSMFLHEHTQPQCLFMWKSNKKKLIWTLFWLQSSLRKWNGCDCVTEAIGCISQSRNVLLTQTNAEDYYCFITQFSYRAAHNIAWFDFISLMLCAILHGWGRRWNNTMKPNCWTPLYGWGELRTSNSKQQPSPKHYTLYVYFLSTNLCLIRHIIILYFIAAASVNSLNLRRITACHPLAWGK